MGKVRVRLGWIVMLGWALICIPACGNDDDDANDDDITPPVDDDDDDDTVEPPPPTDCEIDTCPPYHDLIDADTPDCFCREYVNPGREAYDQWIMVKPEGAVCGNNSEYKFFVNYSPDSNNVLFVLEPGGACWDYPSCAGKGGIRGAANPHGISDDYMTGMMSAHTPLFFRAWNDWEPKDSVPTGDWNFVFIPYCTGDVHTGNNVITYVDEENPENTLEFHHAGHDNVQSVIGWTREAFPKLPRMLISGCSAGGAGTLANYYFFRTGLPQVEKSYMLDDSGPVFPNSKWSKPVHDKIIESWDVDTIIDDIIVDYPEWNMDDFGNLNAFLAERFPEDRLGITYFRRDLNYSLYSYERFWDLDYHILEEKGEILSHWWDDTKELMDLYDRYENLAYYIPYHRPLNSSHCVMILSYSGTEIQEFDMNLATFIRELMDDDAPLMSYLESPQDSEDPPALPYDD